MPRSGERDWFLEIRDDPSKRRGIWSRRSEEVLELCSGREGDDVYLRLQAGALITPELLKTLGDILAHGRAPDTYYDEWEPEDEAPP